MRQSTGFRSWKWVWTLGCRKGPELQLKLYLNVIQRHEYEPEKSRVQCRSRRHSGSSTTWKVMRITTRDALSVGDAGGWQTDMRESEVKAILSQEEKLNLMKY